MAVLLRLPHCFFRLKALALCLRLAICFVCLTKLASYFRLPHCFFRLKALAFFISLPLQLSGRDLFSLPLASSDNDVGKYASRNGNRQDKQERYGSRLHWKFSPPVQIAW
jgi:hypothetical protein